MAQGNVLQRQRRACVYVEDACPIRPSVAAANFHRASAVNRNVGCDYGQRPFNWIERDFARDAKSDRATGACSGLAGGDFLAELRSKAGVAQITNGLIGGLRSGCKRQQQQR